MIPEQKDKSYQMVKANLNSQVYDILKEMIADQRFNLESYIKYFIFHISFFIKNVDNFISDMLIRVQSQFSNG